MSLDQPLLPSGRGERGPFGSFVDSALPSALRPRAAREAYSSSRTCASAADTPWYGLLWATRTTVGAGVWARLILQRATLDAISLSGPALLKLIIDDPRSVYASSMFVGTFVVKAFVESQHSFLRGVTKLKIQCGLQSMVFMSSVASVASEGPGKKKKKHQAQNVILIDCDRASNLALGLLDISSMTVQLVGILVMLFLELSWTALVAVGLMAVLLPLNYAIMQAISRASKRLLEAKDARSSALELLSSAIRYVKAAGLEAWMREKIDRARAEELRALRVIKMADAVCVFLWGFMSIGLAAATFTIFWITERELRPDVVLPVLALFQLVLLPLNALPWVLNGIAEAVVSLRRVDAFLLEVAPGGGDECGGGECGGDECGGDECGDLLFEVRNVIIERGDLRLRVREVQCRRGELLAVQGGVGKSSVLLFFLRWQQMCATRIPGRVAVSRAARFAYVGQRPFVMSGTARENILFGSMFEPQRYARVLRSTRLEAFDDERVLAAGEHAVSGGEAVRIAIARALYCTQSSAILVDDVLGSLDCATRSVVVDALLEEVRGRGRTVVVVTRVKTLIRAADAVLRVEDGVIVQERQRRHDDDEDDDDVDVGDVGGIAAADDSDAGDVGDTSDVRDVRDVRDACTSVRPHPSPVSWASYRWYFSSQAVWIAVTLVSMLVMQATKNGGDILLAWATADGARAPSSVMPTYLVVVFVCALATLTRSVSFAAGGMAAAASVHEQVMDRVMDWSFAAHMSTSAGEISNRMVVDVATVDDSLPFIINIALAQGFGLLGIVGVLLISAGLDAPALLLALFVLGVWYRATQRQYIAATRELKRQEAACRTPMHELVHNTTRPSARDTIRAFRQSDYFWSRFDRALEEYVRVLYVSTARASWLSLRLQAMASFVAAAIVAIGALEAPSTESQTAAASLEGLAIAYILPLTSLLGGLVTSASEVEREMVSVERLHEFQSPVDTTPPPTATTTPAARLAASVIGGPLRLLHVHVRYPGCEKYALKDVTIDFPEGSLTVVVGASGSGKSTLLSVILGMIPAGFGEVTIGGMRVDHLSRRDLQRAIGYLPQRPVLFSDATVRENMDPRKRHTDEAMKRALRRTGLADLNLDQPIGAHGLTSASLIFFSLARLVLLSPRVLLLDEPSSSLSRPELAAFTETLSSAFDDGVGVGVGGPLTIVETSHSVERERQADRVIRLADGAVVPTPPGGAVAPPAQDVSDRIN